MPEGPSVRRWGARSYFDELSQAEFASPGQGGATVRNLGYQPALEGLRAILLILVILGHGQQYLTGRVVLFPIEGLGVMSMFFILSGFLIASIVVKSLQRTGSVQYRKFVSRRMKRLYAPVILFVVVYVIFNAVLDEPLGTPSGSKTLGIVPSAVLMLTSLINFAPTFGYSERFDSVQMWSLGVDMQLYLVMPFIVLGLFHLTTNLRKLLIALAIIFAAFQVIRVVEYYFLYARRTDHHTAEAVIAQSGVYERPENSAGAFLVGIALYLVWEKGLLPVELFRKLWLPVAVVLVILMMTVNPVLSDFSYWFGFTIVSLLGAVIVAETLREGSPIHRVFSGRISRLLGRVSYTVYIWHMLVFISFNRWVRRDMNGLLRMVGAMVVLAVVSAVAWWIAERPLVRLPPVRSAAPSPEGLGDNQAGGAG